MLTNDELAAAIKSAVLAVNLASPFDIGTKEATIKHLESLQDIQRERARGKITTSREPVAMVSFVARGNCFGPQVVRADSAEWDRLKADPRSVREGVPVYLALPEKV